MTEQSAKRALIFGSCVSRDLTRIDNERFETIHYTARQSWISAYSAPCKSPKLDLPSAFQTRMLENDFKSSGRDVLRSTRPGKSDVIILDLIDERLGVIPFKDSWITYSNELEKTGLITQSQLEQLVRFGTDHHFSLWCEAAKHFRRDLDSHMKKVFVIGAKFAEVTDHGAILPKFRGISAATWNSAYSRYYNELENLGFNLISHPSSKVVTSETHLWGPTPFHYVDSAYLSFGNGILNNLSNN